MKGHIEEIAVKFVSGCNIEVRTNPELHSAFLQAATDSEYESIMTASFDVQAAMVENAFGGHVPDASPA